MQYIATEDAPKAIGPYSQAIKLGSLLFTSGQIPLDPATGELVEGDFDTMARRVFMNLEAVLSAAGGTFANVLKTTVFLKNLSDFPALNAVYSEYFGEHKPARSTVAVAQLPLDSLVEIELIASIP